jgi:hypothetical protein
MSDVQNVFNSLPILELSKKINNIKSDIQIPVHLNKQLSQMQSNVSKKINNAKSNNFKTKQKLCLLEPCVLNKRICNYKNLPLLHVCLYQYVDYWNTL